MEGAVTTATAIRHRDGRVEVVTDDHYTNHPKCGREIKLTKKHSVAGGSNTLRVTDHVAHRFTPMRDKLSARPAKRAAKKLTLLQIRERAESALLAGRSAEWLAYHRQYGEQLKHVAAKPQHTPAEVLGKPLPEPNRKPKTASKYELAVAAYNTAHDEWMRERGWRELIKSRAETALMAGRSAEWLKARADFPTAFQPMPDPPVEPERPVVVEPEVETNKRSEAAKKAAATRRANRAAAAAAAELQAQVDERTAAGNARLERDVRLARFAIAQAAGTSTEDLPQYL